jgi:hypothetical protein
MLGTRKSAILVALIALAAPAAAAADVVPTPEAPVVVAGAPVTVEQARQRAGTDAEDFDVRVELDRLVRARWIGGEAGRYGISANPARVAAILARDQRSVGGAAQWRQYLAQSGIPEGEAVAQIGEGALREALMDRITADAHGDARRWTAAIDDFNRRWRAATTCIPGMKGLVRETCGNVAPGKDPCTWFPLNDTGFFGLGDLCRDGGKWAVDLDLIEQFYPRADQADLACEPHGDAAVERLRRYLSRTAPRVGRQLFFDGDCDPQLIAATYRTAMTTMLHAVARIAAHERAVKR